METVTGSIAIREHDLPTTTREPGIRETVVALHKQCRDTTRVRRGALPVDGVRDVGLMIGAVDALAIPTRREIDLHTKGVTLRVF